MVCGCRHRRSPFARRRGGGAEPAAHDTAVGQADDCAYKAHAQTDTVANGAQGRAHCEAHFEAYFSALSVPQQKAHIFPDLDTHLAPVEPPVEPPVQPPDVAAQLAPYDAPHG